MIALGDYAQSSPIHILGIEFMHAV